MQNLETTNTDYAAYLLCQGFKLAGHKKQDEQVTWIIGNRPGQDIYPAEDDENAFDDRELNNVNARSYISFRRFLIEIIKTTY